MNLSDVTGVPSEKAANSNAGVRYLDISIFGRQWRAHFFPIENTKVY